MGHIVIAFRVKSDAEGNAKDPEITRKSRVAFADDKGRSDAYLDTYSGCADDITDRAITAVGQHLGAEFDTCDVGGAYFHGTPTPPEEGGRAVFAEVPKYLHKFGAYPTHNEQGHKNYLRILGNMPGRKDAGAIWARRYDSFLLGIGMRQSVVDRRLFIIATDEGTLMAHIHVDDTRLTFTNRRMRAWFMEKWSAEFDEKPMKSELDEDFVGVTRSVPRSGTIEYTCGGVIKSMHELIKPYPLGQGVTDAYPMSATAPRELREAPSVKNPLVPELTPIARTSCGTIGFIVMHVRPDAYFAFCVLCRYMHEARLTKRAFSHLLRLAWYIVGTADMPLVIHSEDSREAEAGTSWDKTGLFTAWVDTSHGNAEDGASYGGFIIMNKGGGALAWKCKAQEIATDSTGAQELVMATTCYKYVAALRMLLLDMRVGAEQIDPTPMYTDSQILLDGTDCERLVKSSRWLASGTR